MAARPAGTARVTAALRPSLLALLISAAPAVTCVAALSLPWHALDAFLADPAGARITDRGGELLGLAPGAGGSFEEQLGTKEIPAACSAIFVALEDRRFRSHPGVDLLAAARALGNAARGGPRSGASTITMQLARIVAPHPRRIVAKAEEAADALRIESRLSKDQILALWLNHLPFGRNVRGVGAAAWTYFGAEVSSLSPAQLLALAVIPRNPTLYDPFDHPETLIAAARRIAARRRLGVLPAEVEGAVRSARIARPAGSAPHFARFVAGRLARGTLRPAEGQVRTTLDLGLNAFIEARVRGILERYSAARVTNAAVVVIENSTGSVRGWVGSRDFQDAAHDGQVDGVLIRRQSASTLKPFLYALALENGWTAATLLPDVPTVFRSTDEQAYSPENFGRRSHGAVRLRTALASSLNVPAVYTISQLGLERFLGRLGDLGFALPSGAAPRWGLGTAIGNAEVSLLELTRAFSVFARGGLLPDLRLAEGQGKAARRIFDPFSAWMICSILSDPSARVTGFGTRTYFRTDFPAMFKSGTSSEFTNLWCVGSTPAYTVGVWAGNFDGRAVINKTGSIVPTQILTDVLTRVTTRAEDFAAPAGVVPARICTVSGQRPTAACPSTRTEYFRSVAELPPPCVYHGARDREDMLLQESFLKPGQSVRILFPASGEVFFLDETVRSGAQDLPVVVAMRAGQAGILSIDGLEVARGELSRPVTVPLRRGAHAVTVRTPGGSDRVLFLVK
jgi:penicillin-binding protein 1C